MILAWPLLVLLAAIILRQRRNDPAALRQGGHGPVWFLLWTAAGFLMSFSLATGFSIGLLILPFAAISLLWVARRSPYYLEASGFLAGIGATAVLIATIAA